MNIDILNLDQTNPEEILNGKILKTVVNGNFVYDN